MQVESAPQRLFVKDGRGCVCVWGGAVIVGGVSQLQMMELV